MSELSYVEEKEQWQEQINQLKKQHEFSVSICQTLMQDQQVDMKRSYFAVLALSFFLFSKSFQQKLLVLIIWSLSCIFFPQTLSCLLQTLLTGPYSMMPNNVASSQVHLIMHQLNQCYAQLTWQQNNVQRFVGCTSVWLWNLKCFSNREHGYVNKRLQIMVKYETVELLR